MLHCTLLCPTRWADGDVSLERAGVRCWARGCLAVVGIVTTSGVALARFVKLLFYVSLSASREPGIFHTLALLGRGRMTLWENENSLFPSLALLGSWGGTGSLLWRLHRNRVLSKHICGGCETLRGETKTALDGRSECSDDVVVVVMVVVRNGAAIWRLDAQFDHVRNGKASIQERWRRQAGTGFEMQREGMNQGSASPRISLFRDGKVGDYACVVYACSVQSSPETWSFPQRQQTLLCTKEAVASRPCDLAGPVRVSGLKRPLRRWVQDSPPGYFRGMTDFQKLHDISLEAGICECSQVDLQAAVGLADVKLGFVQFGSEGLFFGAPTHEASLVSAFGYNPRSEHDTRQKTVSTQLGCHDNASTLTYLERSELGGQVQKSKERVADTFAVFIGDQARYDIAMVISESKMGEKGAWPDLDMRPRST